MSSHTFFVTGTDTGVGKTHVAAALLRAFAARGLRAVGMKPVAAGAQPGQPNEDVLALRAAGNVDAALADINPYCFLPPIAPHIAAGEAGVDIDFGTLAAAHARLAMRADVVVVEGAGGFLVPFNGESGMDEIPRRLKLPVVMVVGLRLGCLNHALLTEEAIRARGLPVAGWIANHIDPHMDEAQANLTALRSILRSPCLGEIPLSGSSLESAADSISLILKAVRPTG